MEYCGAGSMSDLMMKGRFSLKEEEIRLVVAQVLLGLEYLHGQNKIHRVTALRCETGRLRRLRPARQHAFKTKDGDRHSVLDGSRSDPGGLVWLSRLFVLLAPL